MAVSPDGPFSTAVDKMRGMIAASSNFQAWTGAADATAAKARVYAVDVNTPTRPFAYVSFPLGESILQLGGYAAGQLEIWFEAAVTEADDLDAYYEFMNPVGKIMQDVAKLGGLPGWLSIPGADFLKLHQAPRRSAREGVSDYYEAAFVFSYGTRQG